MSKDYYGLLGVSKNATANDIKSAYRKLAMQHHPDRNPGNKDAEKKFKEITEAYEILKDDQKRAAFDRYGSNAFDGTGAQHGASGFGSSGFQQSGFGDFSDLFGGIFDEFMGGRSNNRRQDLTKGSDLQCKISINLEDVFLGKKETVKYTTAMKCEPCKGSGSNGGTVNQVKCMTCGGRGSVVMEQGFFRVEKPCGACGGTGASVKDPCTTCRGQGRVNKEKTIVVDVPTGVEDGMQIRVPNEGEAGIRGGKSGDLYVLISIRRHKLYSRKCRDLYCNVPLKMTIAALGGEIDVPGIDGKMNKVTIPAGTQNGVQFRLREKGLPALKSSSYGDMFIQVQVETPVNLTPQQKNLLEQFENESTTHSNPESEGFSAKIKSLWDDMKKKMNINE